MAAESLPVSVRVGVVGVGHLGSQHTRVYREMDEVDLVGIADVDESRGHEMAEKNGTSFFGDYRELFGEVDAVSVVTPTESHYPIAREFLEMGVSVLVEKPMTRSVEEARSLVGVAGESHAVLQVGHIERFNPAVQAVKRYIDAPKYIESIRICPYSFRSTDISVVLDLMIHDIDIILSLARSPLAKVEAVGVRVISETEDMANARLVFESGCVANVTASRVSSKTLRQIRVFQKECYISLDYVERSATVWRRPLSLSACLEEGGNGGKEVGLPGAGGNGAGLFSCERLEMVDGEPLRKELEAFVKVVKSGALPVVSAEDGLMAMEAAEMIVKSIRDNSWNNGK